MRIRVTKEETSELATLSWLELVGFHAALGAVIDGMPLPTVTDDDKLRTVRASLIFDTQWLEEVGLRAINAEANARAAARSR